MGRVLDFHFRLGFTALDSILPKNEAKNPNRAKKGGRYVPSRMASKVGKYVELITIKCSMFCAMLQVFGSGFQFSCSGAREPKVWIKFSVISSICSDQLLITILFLG